MIKRSPLKYVAVLGSFLFAALVNADPVPVRHVQGFLRGFLVLKDTNGQILASGDMTQFPAGNRVNAILDLNFKDGSRYQETSVFSQRQVFRLLTYKQVQRGPAFKTSETFSLDCSTGKVSVLYTDKDGQEKSIADQLPLPPDLANGIISMLLSDVDPKAETTLSMLVSSPKLRLVKLKIAATGQDSYSVAGIGAKATHYVVKIDIGGVTGVAAKMVGKQPPPIDFWVATGNAPNFLRSDGPLYEDGPIWRIELASPTWPKSQSQ